MNSEQKTMKCLADSAVFMSEKQINNATDQTNSGARLSDARLRGVDVLDKWMPKTSEYNRHKRYKITKEEYKKHYG